MFASRLAHLTLSLCLLAPFATQAGPYGGIYVFGDSLSDGGSDFALSSFLHAGIRHSRSHPAHRPTTWGASATAG